MGQAKIRSEEIKALKSKGKNKKNDACDVINLIAVKHLKGGGKQVAVLDYRATSINKSKDQLLYEICNHEWSGDGMFNKITNYFSITNNYNIFKMMGVYGFVVNFYERDADYGGAYSCREIIAIKDKESFDSEVKQVLNGSSFIFSM